mmetsp:Transcript_80506/g.180111  ORF Transcript_80506/g.180111 Transcript_80506/m.180111 type:complete len:211 (-) Transcript_80506:98-730(-)
MPLPPGHIAAIHAVRRRREAAKASRPKPSGAVGGDRAEHVSSSDKRQGALRKVFKKYDTNNTGKLEEDQIRNLLTDMDDTTPVGTEPTEEELAFILKVADASGDGCLHFYEVEYALRAWAVYTKRRQQMEDKLIEFDKSGTGTLSWEELRTLLVDLNNGSPVDSMEVDWVMAEADIFGDGQIHKTELVMAIAAWYSHVEKKQNSKMCTIL